MIVRFRCKLQGKHLLCVTCSPAQKSLALVLWSSGPDAAMAKVKAQGWFADGEFETIPQAR